jgi:hypothetical protein
MITMNHSYHKYRVIHSYIMITIKKLMTIIMWDRRVHRITNHIENTMMKKLKEVLLPLITHNHIEIWDKMKEYKLIISLKRS